MSKRLPAFRCYAYKTKKGTFIAECIDLCLITEKNDISEAMIDLNKQVDEYISLAMERNTKGLIPRKSPLSSILRYHFILLIIKILRRFERFKEYTTELDKFFIRYEPFFMRKGQWGLENIRL